MLNLFLILNKPLLNYLKAERNYQIQQLGLMLLSQQQNQTLVFFFMQFLICNTSRLNTFNKYITKAIQSKRVLRTGIKPTPYQKSYEINVGSQSHVVEFKGTNKQFSFIEISLIFDKSE